MPVQATSARAPLRTGLFAAGQDPAVTSVAKAGFGGTTEGLIGSQADPMGIILSRPMGSQAEPIGDAGVSTEEGPTLQQARAAPGQQANDDEEEDHEEGCALALLQEALAAAPGKAKARMSARRSKSFDDGITIGARHMQTDESVLSAAAQLEFAMSSTRQLSSLQQRIADYEKQNGLAALQGLSSMQSLNAGNVGENSTVDDAVSPLKRRIAEYNTQHIMCESPTSASSPRIDSRFGNSSRSNH